MTVSLKDGSLTSDMLVGEDYVYQTSTVTDEFGEYCFLGLNPYKTYAVYEDLDDDWIEVIYEHEGLVFTSSGQELNTGTSFLNAEEVSIAASNTRTATYLERSTPMTVSLKDGESTSTCWSEKTMCTRRARSPTSSVSTASSG